MRGRYAGGMLRWVFEWERLGAVVVDVLVGGRVVEWRSVFFNLAIGDGVVNEGFGRLVELKIYVCRLRRWGLRCAEIVDSMAQKRPSPVKIHSILPSSPFHAELISSLSCI